MGGRLLGAEQYDGLWKLAKKIMLYGTIVSIILMIAGFVFYKPVGRIFSNEIEVLDTFYAVFFILILGLPINAMAFVSTDSLKAWAK